MRRGVAFGTRFALIASFCVAAPAGAATFDALSLLFVPSRFSPGEEVQAQVLLLPERGERLAPLDLKPGTGSPGSSPIDQAATADPELRGLRLAKTAAGWLLSLSFVPWSPGSGTVPSRRVKGIQIPAMPYTALSALGPDDRDPAPPRRQRDPPGTALILYGLAGILIVIALGAAGTAAYLVPAARALLARRRSAQAYQRFVTSLDYLAGEAGSAEPAAFFSALSRAFRLYLAARALPDAAALTAAEIAALPESAFPAPETKDKAAALLSGADRARYGGESPGRTRPSAAMESAVVEVRAIGEANEEAFLARL